MHLFQSEIRRPWADACGLQSRRIAPTLTQLPGLDLTGGTQGTGPDPPVVACLPAAAPCGVANASGAQTDGSSAVAGT